MRKEKITNHFPNQRHCPKKQRNKETMKQRASKPIQPSPNLLREQENNPTKKNEHQEHAFTKSYTPKPLPSSHTHNPKKNKEANNCENLTQKEKIGNNIFLTTSHPHTLNISWTLKNQIQPTLLTSSPFTA